MEGKMPNAGNKLVIETAPWTNGDAIRDMTDEELAKQIADWNSGDCPIVGDCMPIAQNSFTCEPWRCWLDWLKQEATDG